MNILFFGSSKFSLYFLEYLFLKRKDNLIVITSLDKPKGRGLKISFNPVKEFCLKHSLKVYQFENINDLVVREFLKNLNPDIFVVVSFGQIFSKELLEIPKIFPINVHASILPKYRGAAPINWAIINGEKKTGISIIKMEEKMDAGAIILQKEIEISIDDNVLTLEKKLADLGCPLLVEAIERIEKNNFSLIPQNQKDVSFAPKLKKKDGLIDWNKDAFSIYNLIRGCFGWPSAFTYYKGKLLKIHRAEYSMDREIKSINPGEILEVSKKGILVSCAKGFILIKELQIESKRKMSVEEFIRGHKIETGERLG
jgi:methionyl-tRNA formyltransferase